VPAKYRLFRHPTNINAETDYFEVMTPNNSHNICHHSHKHMMNSYSPHAEPEGLSGPLLGELSAPEVGDTRIAPVIRVGLESLDGGAGRGGTQISAEALELLGQRVGIDGASRGAGGLDGSLVLGGSHTVEAQDVSRDGRSWRVRHHHTEAALGYHTS
jgi:hypothetical protein